MNDFIEFFDLIGSVLVVIGIVIFVITYWKQILIAIGLLCGAFTAYLLVIYRIEVLDYFDYFPILYIGVVALLSLAILFFLLRWAVLLYKHKRKTMTKIGMKTGLLAGAIALPLLLLYRLEVLEYFDYFPLMYYSIVALLSVAILLFLLRWTVLVIKHLIYQDHSPALTQANKEMEVMLLLSSPYLNKYRLQEWKDKYQGLYSEIRTASSSNLRVMPQNLSLSQKFVEYYKKGENLRITRNKKYIEQELNHSSAMFDNIENKKLDLQQRVAIVTNEDNNLVIAGAGSGKTSTIVGKVKYLVERWKIKPQRILVLSFTHKSAEELKQRISEEVHVKTFHKLGNSIVKEATHKKHRVYSEEDGNVRMDLKDIINNCIDNTTTFKDDFIRYLYLYHAPFKPLFDTTSMEESVANNRRANRSAIIPIARDNRRLRSHEEVRIYNYLLMNQVDFAYEAQYEYDTASYEYAQYLPDFTIKQDNKRIYLEHFGVNEKGEPPAFMRPAKYKESMLYKIKLHHENKTQLIETYSWEIGAYNFEDILKGKLTAAGVVLRPLTAEQLKNQLQDRATSQYESIITILLSFMALYKGNCHDMASIEKKLPSDVKDPMYVRGTLFISIFQAILSGYDAMLKQKGMIDFGDMIRKATEHVQQRDYIPQYDHIIVDEFQDMSWGRYQLIKKIKEVNPGCVLLGVGDDWQSIYRFAGSDISLLNEFSRHFGCTERMLIESTYRFAVPLLNEASRFILQNPDQIKKTMRSPFPQNQTTIHPHYYGEFPIQDENAPAKTTSFITIDISNAFVNAIVDLSDRLGGKLEKLKIIALGRFNYDAQRLSGEGVQVDGDSIIHVNAFPSISIKFLTVHKAKGLEADIVFLINCKSGAMGFPSELEDDPLLSLLLSKPDSMAHAEERRLFYVAMTRAKVEFHMLVPNEATSPFAIELGCKPPQKGISCPLCKSGIVTSRRNSKNSTTFWGCSNYPYGCTWTSNVDITKSTEVSAHKVPVFQGDESALC